MTFQTILQLGRAWLGLPNDPPEVGGRVFPTTIHLPPRPVYDVVTRAYNFLGALFGLLLLSPLLLTIAAAVKLTSRGPALYRGARVGRGERTFHIFKFRTMHVDAEQRIGKRLVGQDEDHFTPIGKFLRKYRLDELAQLLNVLRGDMNLVGPRPMRPIFLEDHKKNIPGYARRFTVRPGITGQAQVRGGYYTQPRHKLFYDLLYIAHRSVLVDLKLIVLTFLRVMTRIFTTGFLLAWLLLMALVLPSDLRGHFIVELAGTPVNLLYLAPPVIALGQLLRREVSDGRLSALRTPIDLPLIGFLVVTAAIIPLSRFPESAMRGFLWYLCNGAVVFYVVLNSRLVTDRRTTLIYSLVGGVTVVGLVALAQTLMVARETGDFTRLAGTVGNPLGLAAIAVLALPLAVARARQARRPVRRAVLVAACVLLVLVAVLTLSRAGILAAAIALAIYFWGTRRAWVPWVLAGWLTVFVGLAATGDQRFLPANAVRDARAAVSLQLVVLENITPSRLWVGVGARTLPRHVITAQRQGLEGSLRARLASPLMENSYLTLFVDHGPLGLAFFLAFLLGSIGLMFRSARRIEDPLVSDDLRATAAGAVGFAFLLGVSDAVYSFPVMVAFWSALGLGVGLAVTHRRGPRSVYRLIHFRHKL